MKFTLSWLKDYLETTATVAEISAALTALGLEVEGVADPAASLAPFTVAEVLEAAPHPNADKLRVCKVNMGKEVLQIVCGAPNARAGIKVALAGVGATIPTNGLVIKKSKIREVESNGMLCSARELGLGEDHAGIIELPLDAALGESIVSVLGLDDPVIEIAITPNRADCLGVRGIARDLAAAGIGKLKPLQAPEWQGSGASRITVKIEDSGCAEFIGCTLTGVTNGPSPEWMQRRLKAIGLRPISALVDITNYFCFDLARPLHVYDAAKLRGNLTVRASKTGETLAALNDKSYRLEDGMVAITDDSGVIGLGGVIGGVSTGCDESTTEVFLECAWFEPTRIAKTGRALQVHSDARYRFERGADPAFLEEGARLAVQMILNICGGTASELTRAGKAVASQRRIAWSAEKVNQLAGMEIAAEKQRAILEALGFSFESTQVTPPSWRADVEGEADLAEEILRVVGYDALPVTPLPKPAVLKFEPKTPAQQRQLPMRQALAVRGLTEARTWSFLSEENARRFGGGEEALHLANPISADLGVMRPSLLPNLIEAVKRNAARSQRHSALFEFGLQFTDHPAGALSEQVRGGEAGGGSEAVGVKTPANLRQILMATGIRSGHAPKNHYHTERAPDAFDAKADAIAAIEATGFDATSLQLHTPGPGWYHPGRSGSLKLGKQVIAHFGELHPALLREMDAPERLSGFEVFVDAIPLPKRKSATRPALEASDYQPVDRDFAFVVEERLPANDLLRAVRASEKQLIQSVQLFDLYQGKGVEPGKKSLAVTVTLQASDRTLSDQEIEGVAKRIVDSAQKIGAVLRA